VAIAVEVGAATAGKFRGPCLVGVIVQQAGIADPRRPLVVVVRGIAWTDVRARRSYGIGAAREAAAARQKLTGALRDETPGMQHRLDVVAGFLLRASTTSDGCGDEYHELRR